MGPEEILALLTELDAELRQRQLQAEMYVVGGTAMALSGILPERTTQDVDAVVRSGKAAVLEAARVVATRHPGVEPDWLNCRVSAFAALPDDDPDAEELVIGDALLLRIASPEHLLAMKLHAGRAKDYSDILALMEATGVSDREQIRRWLIETFEDRIDAGPPEGVDLEDTLLLADAMLSTHLKRHQVSRQLQIPEQVNVIVLTSRTCGDSRTISGEPCKNPTPAGGRCHKHR